MQDSRQTSGNSLCKLKKRIVNVCSGFNHIKLGDRKKDQPLKIFLISKIFAYSSLQEAEYTARDLLNDKSFNVDFSVLSSVCMPVSVIL